MTRAELRCRILYRCRIRRFGFLIATALRPTRLPRKVPAGTVAGRESGKLGYHLLVLQKGGKLTIYNNE
jgi:hypothetical protein